MINLLMLALTTIVQIAAPALKYAPGSDRPTGYEQGVSAMFAGAVGDTIIMAGGANFPNTPVADGGRKMFYCDIFAKQGSSKSWMPVGILPRPLAYGMNVALSDGLLCLGGNGLDGQSRQVFKIYTNGTIDDSWQDLPVAISEGAATVCNNKVYVAGGVADGIPSAAVWMLDLGDSTPSWRQVCSLPAPAVQPIMTASGEYLYLWYGCNAATGDVSGRGLRYDTNADCWSDIAGHPDEGTFTGAVCATLPDGRIFCTGGVDKDVFAPALKYTKEQMHEYLTRPQSAYKFQGNMLVYDPITNHWHNYGTDLFSLARAGAGIAVTTDGIIVIEGELKPGIRASQIALIPLSALQ